MPPQGAATPAPGPDPGGDCGTPAVYIAACIGLYPGSDCRTFVLGLHALPASASVEWRIDAGNTDEWNYLLGPNPAVSPDHVALAAYCGGRMRVEVLVDGAGAGQITEADYSEYEGWCA